MATKQKINGGPDIMVFKSRGRSKIKAASHAGAVWLVNNIELIEVQYEVPTEEVDDLVKTMQEDGLKTEIV